MFEKIIHNMRRALRSCAAERVAGRAKLLSANILLQWWGQDTYTLDAAKIRGHPRAFWLESLPAVSPESFCALTT